VVPVNDSSPAYFRYADDPEHRKAMLTKFYNRGGEENVALLTRRWACGATSPGCSAGQGPSAELPGNGDQGPDGGHAGARVRVPGAGEDAVIGRTRDDLAELLEIKRRDDPTAAKIEAWDYAYYRRKLQTNATRSTRRRSSSTSPRTGRRRHDENAAEDVRRDLPRTPGRAEMGDGVACSRCPTRERKEDRPHLPRLTARDGKNGYPASYTIVPGRMREDGTYEEPVSAMVGTPRRPRRASHPCGRTTSR